MNELKEIKKMGTNDNELEENKRLN